MKTNIYVDAFNLYFGALKGTPFKWLNLANMCKVMLPKNQIHKIKYFTALVKPRPNDPQQPIRQQTYLRALRLLPNVEIILGHYLSHEVMMPLADSPRNKPKYVKVIKTEEKGSNVNLATHLLQDAYKNDFEVAVVISNDSDLLAPIQIIRTDFRKKVGILNPHKHPSQTLLRNSDFFKTIRPSALKESLFPSSLNDSIGEFHKPTNW
ncbi:MAG: NYN domain-containing protein [Deltaproteobacteria bacterium]|nr:NYN domain-containing protein [Deltaproteobacteria bacterium]